MTNILRTLGHRARNRVWNRSGKQLAVVGIALAACTVAATVGAATALRAAEPGQSGETSTRPIISLRLTDAGLVPRDFTLHSGDYTFVIHNARQLGREVTLTVSHDRRGELATRTLPVARDVVLDVHLEPGVYTVADASNPDRSRQFTVEP